MTNQQIALIVAAVVAAVNSPKNSAPKAKSFTPKSSYKAANKFTPKHQDGLSDRQIKNDVNVAKAFKKQGFLVTPRVDALTYKGWLSKGMRVQAGQKGIWVKGVGTLFHSGQVKKDQPISLVTGQPIVQAVA
jgi:hypothetical protein